MDRGERRDRTERKAKSRRNRMLSVFGESNSRPRLCWHRIEDEPFGKFRNNNVANEHSGGGTSPKTNRRKGHSVHRAKLGAYGPAMDWKPHDQRQIDRGYDDE